MPSLEDVLSATDRLCAEVVSLHAAAVDRDGRFPTESVAAFREAGLLGLLSDPGHGGMGLGLPAAARVVERVARSCGSSAMVLTMHFCGAAVVLAHGTEAHKRAIAQGEALCTLAFSEQGSRSHFWAPVSTARVEGSEVVLDAKKSWVTSAREARYIVWSSRPAQGDGASTIWLVENGAPGLSAVGTYVGLGLRGNDSTPMTGSGLRIPASNRLGPDGGGFDVMMGVVLPLFNACNAACSVGLTQAALGATASHATGTRHEHLGSSLADLPTVRAYLAKARGRADGTRLLWLDTLEALTVGRPDAMLRVLQAKAEANETAVAVTQDCMRLCGGAAYRAEVGVERAFRDARAGFVMAPTSDQLYDFIGKALTGLPLFG